MERTRRARTRAVALVVGWWLMALGWPAPAAGAGHGVAAMAVGDTHACAVRTDGTVWCWGADYDGRLGDGTTGDPVTHLRTTPVRVLRGSKPLRDVTKVAAGGYHSCAVRADGGAMCWGDNTYGQLGNGQAGSSAFRTTAFRVRRGSGYLTGVSGLATGDSHTCALRSDGGVLCWGDGTYGQLGDGDSGTGHLRTRAVRVRHGSGYLRGVTGIAAGGRHTCAAKHDGSAWCWGWAFFGQLGDGGFGGTHHRATPTRVKTAGSPLTRAEGIATGSGHTCVRRADGSVWCFGHDVYGQLGDGTTGGPSSHIRTKPVRVRRDVGTLTHVAGVGDGPLHSCARRSDGSAWCWGYGADGQLGDGTTGDPTAHRRLRAVRVVRPDGPLTRVRRLEGGNGHTCALRTDHTVWCWGHNQFGQLGQGSTDGDPHPYPAKVLFP